MITWFRFSSVQSLSHVWLFATPWTTSTPGFPVHHQLPEPTQTHVHCVDDAIQPSHSLSSPSPPAFNLSQYQGLFQGVSSSHQVAKGLEFQFQHQFSSVHFSSVARSCPTHCNLMNTGYQASLSITNSRSPSKPMSIESVMPSNHLILCHPLLLLLSIFPGIRVFSNESTLCMRWPKYWSFSFSIIPPKEILPKKGGLQNHCRWWLQPWN